jgi:hypothetical protein
MSFPPGTEMFQFPGFASPTYGFSERYLLRGGFPHSEIHGSEFVRNSPRLIAAYHVLHRLSAPRHPPNALKALDHSHCRYPPALRPNGLDRRKDQLRDLSDRGRLRPRVLADMPPLAFGALHAMHRGGIQTNLLFTMSGIGSAREGHRELFSCGHWWSQPVRPQRTSARTDQGMNPAGDTMSVANGGARRDRTDDLLLAKQALSQLSYGPACTLSRSGSAGQIRLVCRAEARIERAKAGGPGKT